MRSIALALPVALVALAACGGAPNPPARSHDSTTALAWQTTVESSHPLVGRIWDVTGARYISPDDVWARLAAAEFVVLGEKHDNPDHHALEARALAAIVARRPQAPAVAFEMLETDQQGAIDAYLRSPGATAEGFGGAVRWEARGWPTYAWYAPIVRVAMDAHLPILAANIPHAQVRALVHDGIGALGDATVKELGLDRPLPDAEAAARREEMKDSHCGMLPDAMLDPMVLAQRARDARMGATMLAASADGRAVVLVAGDGHARKDQGVPAWLAARAPNAARIVSVAFAEVERGVTSPMGSKANDSPAPYDFVWYTPRANDEDPCAKMGR